jgi:hypothetical protein
MLNEPYVAENSTGTLKQLVANAVASADLPGDFEIVIDDRLEEYTAQVSQGSTVAEVIQMCANASGCVVWQDRNAVLRIEPLHCALCDYRIKSNVSYRHPEIELSKPLKAVSVAYGSANHVLAVGTSGETQTVNNPLVNTVEQAAMIAEWVKGTLETRRTVTGEFRADPRLDLFDIVQIESKYGLIAPVAITNIKYTYSGAFRGSYTGRVISGTANSSSVFGEFVLGVSVLGQGA